MDYIVDGSGVYLTRNQDYDGRFQISNNIAYDNGINGLVVHKTTNPDVIVNVTNNIIFDNGKTTKDIEGRQDAGGLTVNSGGASITSNVTLKGNHVTQNIQNDITYQCFGTCVPTSWS